MSHDESDEDETWETALHELMPPEHLRADPKAWPESPYTRYELQLLANIKAALPALKELSSEVTKTDGAYESIYRFYHQSFKVYSLQGWTTKIVDSLQALAANQALGDEPEPLNEMFLKIVSDGTGHSFEHEHNQRWLEVTRPIVEAFLHAKFFLDMVVRYGDALRVPRATIWNAVVAAASDFNAVSPSLLSISASNTGSAITVYEVPDANWSSTPCGGVPSCALFPTSNGNAGTLIYVKATPSPGCPSWTAAGLANRMRHELGHAIGLAHAEKGAHIPGTAWCTQANPANCENLPTYSTVMKSVESCSPVITTLQSDDRASVQALYP